MRSLGVAAIFAGLVGVADAAEGRRMLDAREAQEWRGVGRLNIAGRRFCTASLIAPDVAITAAHCLYNPRTSRPVPLTQMRFVAGLRLGGHAASRRIVAAATVESYNYDGRATMRTLAADVALIALDRPVPAQAAPAFSVGRFRADEPAGLTLVSYARDRAHAPSIERACAVKQAVWPVAALDCEVTFGASGAPVFDEDAAEGAPRLVGVVSALGRSGSGHVALTVAVEPLMAALTAALAEASIRSASSDGDLRR